MTKQTVNEVIEALAKAEPLALKDEHKIINGKGAMGDCARCGELILYYFKDEHDVAWADDGRSYCPICGQKYKRWYTADTDKEPAEREIEPMPNEYVLDEDEHK